MILAPSYRPTNKYVSGMDWRMIQIWWWLIFMPCPDPIVRVPQSRCFIELDWDLIHGFGLFPSTTKLISNSIECRIDTGFVRTRCFKSRSSQCLRHSPGWLFLRAVMDVDSLIWTVIFPVDEIIQLKLWETIKHWGVSTWLSSIINWSSSLSLSIITVNLLDLFSKSIPSPVDKSQLGPWTTSLP